MMTIRQAINTYSECKKDAINYLNKKHGAKTYSLNEIIQTTSLCVIIPLHNGVTMFIDTHPEVDSIREKFPEDMPNKNCVFKRLSFEIEDGGNPVFPDSIKKHVSVSECNGIAYFIDSAKERVVNEFISYNGGIDEEAYKIRLNNLFNWYYTT